jgi:two-component system heavy metal sensor histidine kinase CusS
MENAIRHAKPGTPVLVTASSDGLAAIVGVVNVGSPIDPATMPRLFERFVRGTGDDASGGDVGSPTASPHAGLGLAIAKAIVDASGGSIEAASDASTTRFTVRLPLRPGAGSQPILSDRGVALA